MPKPRSSSTNPLINSYEAGDGRWFWLLGLEADRHWPPLVQAIGRPELAEDERFGSAKDRRINASKLIALLDETFATADRDHWTAYVEFRARYDWGWGKHLMSVPAERVRLADTENDDQPPGG